MSSPVYTDVPCDASCSIATPDEGEKLAVDDCTPEDTRHRVCPQKRLSAPPPSLHLQLTCSLIKLSVSLENFSEDLSRASFCSLRSCLRASTSPTECLRTRVKQQFQPTSHESEHSKLPLQTLGALYRTQKLALEDCTITHALTPAC